VFRHEWEGPRLSFPSAGFCKWIAQPWERRAAARDKKNPSPALDWGLNCDAEVEACSGLPRATGGRRRRRLVAARYCRGLSCRCRCRQSLRGQRGLA
jgi:hypothetical protein